MKETKYSVQRQEASEVSWKKSPNSLLLLIYRLAHACPSPCDAAGHPLELELALWLVSVHSMS